jgi:hypothetical protein
MVDLTYSPLQKTATFGGGNALIGKGSALMAGLALTANRGGLALTASLTYFNCSCALAANSGNQKVTLSANDMPKS